MASKGKSSLQNLQVKKIILPLLIGFGIAFYILYKSFDPNALAGIEVTETVVALLVIALLSNVFRALGYMWRLRILTDHELSWRQCFQVIMLWEFSSTITPGIVGGAAVAIFLLNRERVNLGRSTGIVMLTGFLDEVVFLIPLPFLFWYFGKDLVSSATICEESQQLPLLHYVNDLSLVIFGIYIFLLIVTLLIGYGLFIRPRAVKYLFIGLARMQVFKKWKPSLLEAGEDIFQTSRTFRQKPLSFWVKAFASTLLSWTARFILANCIVWALGLPGQNDLLVYARQYTIWLMMLVPTTPGGSGIAEISFLAFMCEFFPGGITSGVVLVWRMLSYYIYLIIGVFVLPRWISRVFKSTRSDGKK